MPWQVMIVTATGLHGPMEIPEGFLADNPDPTAPEILAEFSRRIVEDLDALGMADRSFKPPLTITVEQVG